MFIETGFSYDSITSQDMGVLLVSVDSGLKEKSFGLSRSTVTEKVKGRMKPYFYGFNEEVITFTITIMKNEGTWSFQDKLNICRWLFKSRYCDFISDDNSEVVYRCVAVGEPKFHTADNEKGYAVVSFECDAPYVYSNLTIQEFDLSGISSPTTIQIQNLSNIDDYYMPEIQFTLAGTETSFKMVNLNYGGRAFEFTGLVQGETIYINNDKKQILSDSGNYRYDKLANKQFFRLVYGINNCVVYNKALVQIRAQFPIMI